MRILVDENTPVQLVQVLQRVLPRHHQVDHVHALGWSGKKDIPLLRDAAAKGYDVLITMDANQLHRPDELDAVRKSKMHHVRFALARKGLTGIALAMGAVVAAMPLIIAELEETDSQRLIQIKGLNPDPKARYECVDPKVDPPRYWPR